VEFLYCKTKHYITYSSHLCYLFYYFVGGRGAVLSVVYIALCGLDQFYQNKGLKG